jgi:hypothetical protein
VLVIVPAVIAYRRHEGGRVMPAVSR